MRVIGEIPHPVLKITVFAHNDRFTLQIENGVFSQHYRIRKQTGIEDIDDLQRMVNKTFLDGVSAVFKTMHHLWQEQVTGLIAMDSGNEFEQIH